MKNVLSVVLMTIIGMSVCMAQPMGFAADEASEEVRQAMILEESDVKANDLLKKVYSEYDAFRSIKAKLSVTTKQKGVASTKLGTVTVKNTKYKVETPEQEIVSDGITSWLHLKKDNSVMINRYEPNDNTLFAYPTAVLKQYQEDYVAKFISEKVVNGKSMVRIDLLPFDEEGYYRRISVDIDKKNLQISKLTLYQSSTEFYTVEVKSLLKNHSSIVDELFTFDTSSIPSSKIRDLR